MLAAVLLFVLPRNYGDLLRGHYTPILTWKQVVPKFPWELLLFIGGLTTITSVADVSNAHIWDHSTMCGTHIWGIWI